MRRWPQWRLDPGTRAVFQEDSGMVRASNANRVHRELAAAHGGVLRERSPVTAIRDAGGELELQAAETRCRVQTLVVAADGWTNDVRGMLDVPPLPFTLTQEHVVYLDPEAPGFGPDRFPVWIWMDDPSFYGVPAMDGLGPKVAQDVGGRAIAHPDARGRAEPEAFGRALRFASERVPGASRRRFEVRPCTYTLTPDRDFVLDRLPGHPNVLLALGAAHGFKFAAWFGEALARLAVGEPVPDDLTPFAIDRPMLRMDDPPRRFLV
jgi:sarcosine oxidase